MYKKHFNYFDSQIERFIYLNETGSEVLEGGAEDPQENDFFYLAPNGDHPIEYFDPNASPDQQAMWPVMEQKVAEITEGTHDLTENLKLTLEQQKAAVPQDIDQHKEDLMAFVDSRIDHYSGGDWVLLNHELTSYLGKSFENPQDERAYVRSVQAFIFESIGLKYKVDGKIGPKTLSAFKVYLDQTKEPAEEINYSKDQPLEEPPRLS